MSFATRPIDAANIAVTPPMIATVSIAAGDASNTGKNRATRKTPAATIVAACISALTGVGPSIASGSQVWSGNCADLPTAPAKIPSETSITAWSERTPVRTASMISWIIRGFSPAAAKASRLMNRYRMARRKPKSPSRVIMNAFLAAAAAAGRSYQNPMSRYEHRPTSSQKM